MNAVSQKIPPTGYLSDIYWEKYYLVIEIFYSKPIAFAVLLKVIKTCCGIFR